MNKVTITITDPDGKEIETVWENTTWTKESPEAVAKAAIMAVIGLAYHTEAPITPEAHKYRHEELHRSFDELLADWIHHKSGSIHAEILDLMTWSNEQQQNPTSTS